MVNFTHKKTSNITQLTLEEARLKLYWSKIKSYLLRDLANVWTDGARDYFNALKLESKRIGYLLRRIHSHYRRKDKQKYNQEILDIRTFLKHLNNINSKAKWVKQIDMDLQQIILDIEGERQIAGVSSRVTRREFLRRASGAVSLPPLVSRTKTNYSGHAQSAKIVKCTFTIEQVRKGQISPVDYLREKSRCLPELAEALNNGTLLGIGYESSPEQIETQMRKLLSGRVDESSINYWVRAALSGGFDAPARTYPGIVGSKIPNVIDFTRNLFFNEYIINDADVEHVIKHELKHARDFYYGIRLSNFVIDYRLLLRGLIRMEFYHRIKEMRADYEDLANMFKEYVEGRSSVSKKYNDIVGLRYARDLSFVKGYPANATERKVRDLQLAELKGIIPEKADDGVILKFNLFERSESLLIK